MWKARRVLAAFSLVLVAASADETELEFSILIKVRSDMAKMSFKQVGQSDGFETEALADDYDSNGRLKAVGNTRAYWRDLDVVGSSIAAVRSGSSVSKLRARNNGEAWQAAYDIAKQLARNPQLLEQRGETLLSVEPSAFLDKSQLEDTEVSRARSDSQVLRVTKEPMGVWPPKKGSADWYLGNEFTALRTANDLVSEKRAEPNHRPAQIAIIDNKFDVPTSNQTGHLMLRDFGSAAKNPRFWATEKVPMGGDFGGESHGTATLSILAGAITEGIDSAGRAFSLQGANPAAEVFGVSGAKGVAHIFDSRRFAHAFKVAKDGPAELPPGKSWQTDVISASHGGMYSLPLKDAVDSAYMRGIVVVTASGNHIRLLGPFPPSTPRSVVFPAAFDSVIGVSGLTAKDRPYYDNPSFWGFFRHGWNHRGNAGPGRIMDRIVSSYSPNIPWAQWESGNAVDLDGAGTSAATPQVAGAASLWIEKYRGDIEQLSEGIPWKRAEIVYRALLKHNPSKNPTKLGASTLKATQLLNTKPEKLPQDEEPHTANRGPSILEIVAWCFFQPDGGKNLDVDGKLKLESLVDQAVWGADAETMASRTLSTGFVDHFLFYTSLETELAQQLQAVTRTGEALGVVLVAKRERRGSLSRSEAKIVVTAIRTIRKRTDVSLDLRRLLELIVAESSNVGRR